MAGSESRRHAIPIVWPKPAHTDAKHKLLRAYLGGWYPILARYDRRIIYLDAFAGPGVYADGEPGSPIIALETLLDHRRLPSLGSCEFRFNFLEVHHGRLMRLRTQLAALKEAKGGWPANVHVRSAPDTFVEAAHKILNYLERRREPLPPTFAFIDPFGPKGLPMEMIGRLLDARKCEVCVHVMLGGVTRWIRAGRPDRNVRDLFGTEDYREAEDMAGARRQWFLLKLYKRQLRELGGFHLVTSFSLFGLRNQWVSAVVYGTNNVRGMEVMKRAMWQVDPVRGGRFSDRDHPTGQLELFGDRKSINAALRAEILSRFRGRRAQVSEIASFVVGETDFGPQHWKGALRDIQLAHELRVITPVASGRAGTFPHGTVVQFMD
jgi:three-Cys-motif partner protein